jgi:sugar phosphate isomerase/epimerase
VARVGLMLYTVRRECADDFLGTLRAVAGLGYEGVELFDLHGHSAEEVRGWLDEFGLAVAGRHAGLEALESELDALADECRVVGTDRLVLSWVRPPASSAEAKELAGRLAGIAREAARLGLRFGFHNHDGEVRPLDGGSSFLEELLAGDDVFLELDLGWAWYGGVDPSSLLGRASGRCPLVHVKDFASRERPEFRPVGDGLIDYARILPVAVETGVEWLLVEQDETDGPALAAAERSLAAVKVAV